MKTSTSYNVSLRFFWYSLEYPLEYSLEYPLWQGCHRCDIVLFSLCPFRGHAVLKCSVTDNVHIDHLIKVMSVSHLHCEVFGRGWGTLRNVLPHQNVSFCMCLYQYGPLASYFISIIMSQIHCYHLFLCSHCLIFLLSERFYKLTSVSSWHDLIILWALFCFLAQAVLMLTLFFFCFSLESAISPKALSPHSV